MTLIIAITAMVNIPTPTVSLTAAPVNGTGVCPDGGASDGAGRPRDGRAVPVGMRTKPDEVVG